jgi:hypothetical protein
MGEQATTTPTPVVDIARFCGREFDRYDWRKPVVVGRFKYASDGRLCVRVPAAEGEVETDLVAAKFPDPSALAWPRTAESPATRPWPPAGYRMRHEAVIQFAEGENDDTDLTVTATSRFERFWPAVPWQWMGKRIVGTVYHARVADLPNVKYDPEGARNTPIYFAFDGGEGLLMPASPGGIDDVCGPTD